MNKSKPFFGFCPVSTLMKHNAPLFHPHLIPLLSRERLTVLLGKYGGRELEGGGEVLQDKGFEFRYWDLFRI
jgi:hypothetical protein